MTEQNERIQTKQTKGSKPYSVKREYRNKTEKYEWMQKKQTKGPRPFKVTRETQKRDRTK